MNEREIPPSKIDNVFSWWERKKCGKCNKPKNLPHAYHIRAKEGEKFKDGEDENERGNGVGNCTGGFFQFACGLLFSSMVKNASKYISKFGQFLPW